MYRLLIISCVALIGCQDYRIFGVQDPSLGDEAGANGQGETYWIHRTAWPCGTGDDLPDQVPLRESCVTEQVTGVLDAVVEWEIPNFTNYGEYSQVLMAPMVGQLNDDDGDGDIDRDDIPDIVLVSDDEGEHQHHKGILRIIGGSGDGPEIDVQRADFGDDQIYPYRYSNLALGDIDGDGEPEIVGIAQLVPGPPGGGDTGDPVGDDTGDGGGGGGADDTGAAGGGDDTGGDPGGVDDTGGGPVDTGDTGDNPVRFAPRDRALTEPGSGTTEPCRVAAWDAGGAVEWVSQDIGLDCAGHAPSLADLEGDGLVEVVVGPYILAGATGRLRVKGEQTEGRFFAYAELGMHSVVADLDGDGVQEVAAGPTLYDPDGQVICTQPGLDDGFNAVADFDLDGVGDVVVVGNGRAGVMSADCTLMARWDLVGGGNGGPPTVADLDGDGVPEIGVADATTYGVYEADGTPLWSVPTEDESSHATGSVIFDFEGDAHPEVVYADETRLWVLDGATGDVRFEDSRHASRTLHEFPTVADVDGDGQAEIIVPNGGGHLGEDLNGIYILGGDPGWLNASQVWNQHAFSITNVNDDLSIPTTPEPNWPVHNSFRSGDPNPVGGGSAADAVPEGLVCGLECASGRLLVTARVGNSGLAGLRGGLPVSIYTDDGMTWLGTGYTAAPVMPGEVSGRITFEVDRDRVVDDTIEVVVDDERGVGWARECAEDNNLLVLDDMGCP